MKALQLERPSGEPKKGQRNIAALREVPTPQPSSDQVLIKILAAGFNRRDEWSMVGAYPGLVYKDATMGCDGAGVIVSPSNFSVANNSHPDNLVLLTPTRGWHSDPSGPETELPGLSPEQRSNGLGGSGFGILGATKPTNGVGTFAEYVAVEKDQLVAAPKHLTAEQAATLPCAAVTAYRALFTKAQLTKGQNLLLTGVGGGVAMLALQMAVAADVNVYVTGGSAEKIARAVKLGAKAGTTYKDASWPDKIRNLLPASRPYLDCVVDSAGGEIAVQSQKAGLKAGGKVVIFGMTAAPKLSFTMREVLKNIEVLGSTMGSAREFEESIRFVERHRIVPVVDTVLDGLERAADGFELLAQADRRSGGKVVVRVAKAEGQKSKL